VLFRSNEVGPRDGSGQNYQPRAGTYTVTNRKRGARPAARPFLAALRKPVFIIRQSSYMIELIAICRSLPERTIGILWLTDLLPKERGVLKHWRVETLSVLLTH
jgi:hypothetical protein